LVAALRYESPLPKFVELVKEHHSWINYRDGDLPDGVAMSMLSRCAIGNLTNHVRVLIENGADTAEAIRWHEEYGTDEAIALIKHAAQIRPTLKK
jgi:hypothetical protein